jgi:hypothetical protein
MQGVHRDRGLKRGKLMGVAGFHGENDPSAFLVALGCRPFKSDGRKPVMEFDLGRAQADDTAAVQVLNGIGLCTTQLGPLQRC